MTTDILTIIIKSPTVINNGQQRIINSGGYHDRGICTNPLLAMKPVKLKKLETRIVLVQRKKYFGKNYYYPWCNLSEILAITIGRPTLIDRELFWLRGLNYEFYEFDTGKQITPTQ